MKNFEIIDGIFEKFTTYCKGFKVLFLADKSLNLDELDFRILMALKENGKISLNKLEEMLQKKSSTLHARIKKLESNKIIKNYSINIDNKAIGQSLIGFIMLNVDQSL